MSSLYFDASIFNSRLEINVEVTSSYYDPGRYSGLPENCYPCEREVNFGAIEIVGVKNDKHYKRLIEKHWDALSSYLEDKFWELSKKGHFNDY